MTPTEPRIQAALDGVLGVIVSTVGRTAEQLAEQLGPLAMSQRQSSERDQLLAAQFEFRRNLPAFHRAFREGLQDKVTRDLARAEPVRQRVAATDWQALSLVDDREVEENMLMDRLGQQVVSASEWELREAGALLTALLRSATGDERNPLRGEILGSALYRAVQAVSADPQVRKTLARELGMAVAKALPAGLQQITRDLQARGIQPTEARVRAVDGPGNQLHGVQSAYQSMPADSRGGQFDATGSGFVGTGGHGTGTNTRGGASTRGGSSTRMDPAELHLMNVLRRLTVMAGRAEGDSGGGSGGGGASLFARSGSGGLSGGARGAAASQFGPAATGMMAVNLIRAHRDELMQASPGRLDHMVIDVVGSLFDQILSDQRVPPQMARQIARLQLPVLRVALADASFFSSRRHPVRRFVNRIASLACAFDDFSEGAGKEFLVQVRDLVQEIVEGDFDQIELYTAKLAQLEAFIGAQTQGQVQQTPAAATLEGKEADLRLQQRYMLQLQAALAPVPAPPYVRDFLSQVWTQALLQAARRDGPASERVTRFRRAGRELVMSVQPKGSPVLRKKFLMQLPMLMKDLKDGMALIGWPDPAQKEFFGKLLPAHAESLKGQPLSELDYNMMSKQLETVFGSTMPGLDSITAGEPVTEEEAAHIEEQFTAEEVRQVGLVQESAVDWSREVDIDLSEETNPTQPGEEGESADSAPIALGIDLNLDLAPSEPAEPTRGAALFEHVRLGFAYQMHLKDQWQKVRLTYVSPGRAFFVFTHGRKHQETISMTARMLSRMCETGRMRAFENAYLLERATQRARKQLAALGAATRH